MEKHKTEIKKNRRTGGEEDDDDGDLWNSTYF